jgi:hypothetical protein
MGIIKIERKEGFPSLVTQHSSIPSFHEDGLDSVEG